MSEWMQKIFGRYKSNFTLQSYLTGAKLPLDKSLHKELWIEHSIQLWHHNDNTSCSLKEQIVLQLGLKNIEKQKAGEPTSSGMAGGHQPLWKEVRLIKWNQYERTKELNESTDMLSFVDLLCKVSIILNLMFQNYITWLSCKKIVNIDVS